MTHEFRKVHAASSKWFIATFAGLIGTSVFAQAPLSSPPQTNLKLLPIAHTSGEPSKPWIETGSIVRRGQNTEVWVFQALMTDSQIGGALSSGQWMRMVINCPQQTLTMAMFASVLSNGQVQPAYSIPGQPPITARPETTGGKVVARACAAIPANTAVKTSLAAAITETRNPTAFSQTAQVATPAPRPPATQAFTPAMRTECHHRYKALATALTFRRVIADGLTASDRQVLASSETAYRERAKTADPNVSDIVSLAEGLRRTDAYKNQPKNSPEALRLLNDLKAKAAECDGRLGLTALPMP